MAQIKSVDPGQTAYAFIIANLTNIFTKTRYLIKKKSADLDAFTLNFPVNSYGHVEMVS